MTIRSDITMFWELSPRIIQIDAPSTEISIQDLIDTCSYLSFQAANMDDAVLLESSGKEYLTEDGSVKVGLTVTLNNAKIAFEARSGPSWILCSIEGGNAVAVEDIYTTPRVYFDVRQPTAYTSVDRVSASSATLSELSAIQYASFGDGVTINIIDGIAGTDFPIGTKETPVNNLTDAVAIANTRGFDVLFISNSMSLDSGTDIANFALVGKSPINIDIVVEPSAICDNIIIQNCNVSGTLDGGTEIEHCLIGNLLYVNGHIHTSGLYDTIVLGGNESAVITDCYTVDQDTPPTIDMGGSGQDLVVSNYSGIINVKNLSSASEEIIIGIDAGRVILEDTITAGTIIISGIGQLIDNSTGTANVDTDGLMSKQTITEISWDAIYIDTTNGGSGTDFPAGTAGTPSNNIIDACTIAANNNIKIFNLRGAIDLPQTFEDYTFVGTGSILNDIVNLNSQTINGCRFEALTVSGTVSASDSVYLRCSIRNVIGLDGLFIDSVLQGTLTMGGVGSTVTGQNIAAYGNTPGSPAVINMGGTGRVFQASLDGAIYFTTAASGSVIEIGLKNGTAILDPTCTGGTALFTGVGDLINYSTMTVTDRLLSESSISDQVWDEPNADHLISGSTGESLAQAATASGGSASITEQDKLDIADRVWSEDLSTYNTGAGRIQQLQIFDGYVRIDTVSGTAGTDFPIGTYRMPSNNLTDTLTICANNNIARIRVRSDLTIESSHDVSNTSFESRGIMGMDITFELGCSTSGSTFRYLNLEGELNADDVVLIENCSIYNLKNFTGIMQGVSFIQGSECSIGSWAEIYNCRAGGEPGNEPEISIGDSILSIQQYRGNLKFINKTGDNRTVASFLPGNVIIADTCVSGTIQILGIGQVESDNSGPNCKVDIDAAVTNDYIADHVWDESTADHIAADSYGEWASTVASDVVKTLGLSQENFYLDNTIYTTYSGIKLLTSGRLRTYTTAGSVGTGSDVIATYQITSVWTGDELDTYKVVKQ